MRASVRNLVPQNWIKLLKYEVSCHFVPEFLRKLLAKFTSHLVPGEVLINVLVFMQ